MTPCPLLGIIANTTKSGAAELLGEILSALHERKIPYNLEARTALLIGAHSKMEIDELGDKSDLILVLGGDGTMLQAVRQMGEHLKPFLGINYGSLGFLTCIGANAYLPALDALAAGNYVLSRRALLHVEVMRDGDVIAQMRGLNDAVISRGEHSNLIKLTAWIDGSPLTEYNADGVIIATPTGSTAYSLAAGGPLMMPSSGVFVMTPVCPHVLTTRPLIVGEHSIIEVSPRADQRVVYLSVDGQDPVPIAAGDVIRIKKSAQSFALVMLPGTDFFALLRQKLKWGGSAL